ncbi:hypothetical protein Val02_10440 [Virgisporangium aliadipatigenens]|uniref:DUF4132 domain-containing protein n=1 Tax=Virgisporangium aliadipatigenens TaxID=741659 RepID=A0A8J4DP20_9ACTN|nr:DUF4132 domain-containing protein [Virgisporangium aliadipatigenens]GIJ44158.1 hypothetical protein Val02_10440 [Virgisporangium aliadipatigenens]
MTREETLVFPPTWYPLRFPRRGSRGLSAWGPKAGRLPPDSYWRRVEAAVEHPLTPEDLRRAARDFLSGAAGATPVGAAVAAVTATAHDGRQEREESCYVVHDWIARYGTEFALRAAVEALTLTYDYPGGRPGMSPPFVRRLELTADDLSLSYYSNRAMTLAGVVRAVLAGASDAEYAAMVAVLAAERAMAPPPSEGTVPPGHGRASDLRRRVATSFLAPSETDWVDADCAEVAARGWGGTRLGQLLMLSIGTPAQAETLRAVQHAHLVSGYLLYTVFEGLGADVVDIAVRADGGTPDRKFPYLAVLGAIPTDRAFGLLVERLAVRRNRSEVLKAAKRYPRRAVRMLAEAAGGAHPAAAPAAGLLRELVAGNPDVAAEVLPTLGEEAAGRLRALLPSTVDSTAGAASASVGLPAILVRPPWTERRKTAPPAVVPGLVCTDAAAMAWLPGEREAWGTFGSGGVGRHRWPRIVEDMARGQADTMTAVHVIAAAPEELVRPVLATWRPARMWGAGRWTRMVAARFELDALPLVLACAERDPVNAAGSLAPYAAPEVAVLMAAWTGKGRTLGETARAWLVRHAALAARALIPRALGAPGPARRDAERALTLLATDRSPELLAAAEGYGSAAVAGIGALLAADPLAALPARMPTLPGWCDPGLHPPIRLRAAAAAPDSAGDDDGVLPADAVRHVCTMLAISPAGEPYAGLAAVRDACEPADLAAFAWSLHRRWLAAGAPTREAWAFRAVGVFGDDDTARRLAALIRAWPGEAQHARAVAGLDVLAAIGSDVALTHLSALAHKAPYPGLRKRAGEKIDEVAAGRGLSTEELADRLVPDFGLGADGGLILVDGTRRFRVGFDASLRPFVVDEDGKRRAQLPRTGAPEAYRRFAELKKDVRTVADLQVTRLEQAMLTGRRWSGADFRRFLVGHPLMGHLARRLVWGRFDASGAFLDGLRVAEDRTFADVHDDPLVLGDEELIGVAHPVQLGATVPAWGRLFADYALLQPFPQIERKVYGLGADGWDRYVGLTVPTGRLVALERRGWRRGAPQDAGVQEWLERPVPGGELIVRLSPGIIVGAFAPDEPQTLEKVELTVETLDAVTASEIIMALNEVTGER